MSDLDFQSHNGKDQGHRPLGTVEMDGGTDEWRQLPYVHANVVGKNGSSGFLFRLWVICL